MDAFLVVTTHYSVPILIAYGLLKFDAIRIKQKQLMGSFHWR